MKNSNLEYPSLEVIDRAIQVLKAGGKRFSCNALLFGISNVLNEPWFGTVGNKYLDQYSRWVFEQNGGCFPSWWDGTNTAYNRKARLKALKGFRQACIKAAKQWQ